MTKRQHGMGTVTEYQPGAWQIKYTTKDGRRSKSGFTSKKAAETALAAAITDVDRGDYFDERKGRTPFLTVAQEHVALADLREGTRANYRTLLRTALASFALVPFADISVRRMDRWWSTQSVHPVNRRNAYFLTRAIMKSAIRWRYIQTSPCIQDGAGKDVAKPRPTWTLEQYETVLGRLDKDFAPAIEMMFSARLRLGELVGPNTADYDLASGRVRVPKQRHGVEAKTRQHKRIKLMAPGHGRLPGQATAHRQRSPCSPDRREDGCPTPLSDVPGRPRARRQGSRTPPPRPPSPGPHRGGQGREEPERHPGSGGAREHHFDSPLPTYRRGAGCRGRGSRIGSTGAPVTLTHDDRGSHAVDSGGSCRRRYRRVDSRPHRVVARPRERPQDRH